MLFLSFFSFCNFVPLKEVAILLTFLFNGASLKKKLELGDIKVKIDWGYAKDYVEAAYNIMQLKKPDFFIIASSRAYSVEYFAKKCFEYVGLNYKKYLRINKKLLRPSKNVSLIGDTAKAKKKFNFKIETDLDEIISIMMQNDLVKEKK